MKLVGIFVAVFAYTSACHARLSSNINELSSKPSARWSQQQQHQSYYLQWGEEPPPQTTTTTATQTTDEDSYILLSEQDLGRFGIGVSSTSSGSGVPSDFFNVEYWYSFRPVLDAAVGGDVASSYGHPQQQEQQHQQWEVRRIPKSSTDNKQISASNESISIQRKLQESSALQEKKDNNEQYHDYHTDPNNTDTDTTSKENSRLTFLLTNTLLSLICVIGAALAAGLTMGLLSLDPLSLEIKRRASPSMKERKWSEELLPLLVGHSKRHRLLVSLLLLNSVANEALPLFLDELLPGKVASILVSVTLVLFMGEIVPSAFFTGPNQVEVAARLVPLVKVLLVIFAPLAIPIGKLLDRVMHGDEGNEQEDTTEDSIEEEDVTGGNYYNRGELGALVRIQYEAQLAAKRKRKQLNQALLLPKTGALRGDGGGGTPSASEEGSSNHHQQQLSSHPSVSSVGNGTVRSNQHTHTYNSIRSIGRELTSSTSSQRHSTTKTVSKRPTPKRIPSIHADEITMIEGALSMTTKVAADVCTPLRGVYSLPDDTILDEDTCCEIWARGYSRVPVFGPRIVSSDADASAEDGGDSPALLKKRRSVFEEIDESGIIGVLLTRQLIVMNPSECRPLASVPLVRPPCVAPSIHLVDLINLFQAGGGRGKGGLHLALVCARPNLATEALERGGCVPKEAGVVGIVTLEDVVEELLQEEIYDEYDRELELARWGVNKWKKFVKKKKAVGIASNSSQTVGVQKDGMLGNTMVKKVVIASTVTNSLVKNETTPLLSSSS